ncbi:hypothetical protein K469DRAFT_709833 [Zopfia rhizophila CBS 207.26]|uniref:Uncharacterized protein n=1 Tax=Zopfia rhizophila CBS 207.26 TaxID=1314779 RepID=A0A6A6ET31_9PEZI|nr:hypothetical protein K469DRAFT_709833 [Zopfia rhizophila CBS 207.26]
MFYTNLPSRGEDNRRQSGHQYQDIGVTGGNNHFGDRYYGGLDNPLSYLPYGSGRAIQFVFQATRTYLPA